MHSTDSLAPWLPESERNSVFLLLIIISDELDSSLTRSYLDFPEGYVVEFGIER
jgi:hypothetical protein